MQAVEDYWQQAPDVKTKIDWNDVRDKRYVILNPRFQIKIVEKAIEKAGSQTNLIKLLGKSESQIRNYKKGKFNLTIGTLRRLVEIAGISLKQVRRNIICLGGIVNPKLPFNMSTVEGIKIRAKILSDGYNPTNPEFNVGYRAGELESHIDLVLSFKKRIGNLQGEYGIPKPYKNAYSTQFPPVFGDVLELSSVPRGWKSVKNPFIPRDIICGSRLGKLIYLREAFTDEGCIELSKGYRVVSLCRNISVGTVDEFSEFVKDISQGKIIPFKKLPEEFQNKLKNKHPKLILGEFLLLKELGIDCRLRPKWIRINKNGTISLNWKLLISRKRNLKLFKKIINFSLESKRKKLEKIIRSYDDRAEPGQGYERALVAARSLTSQKKFFTSKELASKLSIRVRSATKYLKKMIKNKDVTILKKWKYATVD